MARYLIPAARVRVEEVILRSRFITTVSVAPTVEGARSFVSEMRAEFSDATHNCFAFLVGPPGSSAQAGMSDDGEPAGTAGRPMLAVLSGCGAGDIAVVVTRYFGGTKLGTGGLVRAYSGGVKAALAELPLTEKVLRVTILAVGPYSWVTPVARLLPGFEVQLL
ncbi:MAG TPA: YigZ family protein, partial [Anaerolineae bacterium]